MNFFHISGRPRYFQQVYTTKNPNTHKQKWMIFIHSNSEWRSLLSYSTEGRSLLSYSASHFEIFFISIYIKLLSGFYRDKTQLFSYFVCYYLLSIYRLCWTLWIIFAPINWLEGAEDIEHLPCQGHLPAWTFALSGKLIKLAGIYYWKQARVNLTDLISCVYRTVGVPNSQVCLVAMLTADSSHKIAWKMLLRLCRLEALMWMGDP